MRECRLPNDMCRQARLQAFDIHCVGPREQMLTPLPDTRPRHRRPTFFIRACGGQSTDDGLKSAGLHLLVPDWHGMSSVMGFARLELIGRVVHLNQVACDTMKLAAVARLSFEMRSTMRGKASPRRASPFLIDVLHRKPVCPHIAGRCTPRAQRPQRPGYLPAAQMRVSGSDNLVSADHSTSNHGGVGLSCCCSSTGNCVQTR